MDLHTRWIFRMTHIDNIPHVLTHGITHVLSPNANKNYKPIGDATLIQARNKHRLINGKNLGDFTPFYFGTRTPMLYVIQKGHNMVTRTPPEKIVYCVSSVQDVIDQRLDFVFTDGHAEDRLSTCFSSDDLDRLSEVVDWDAVNAQFWKDDTDLDKKRRKSAEFLILGDLAPEKIRGFVVFDANAKNQLLEFGIQEHKVVIKPAYYY
jgi:hypothetical protein